MAHEKCRFCEWIKDWDSWKECSGQGKERCIEKTDNEDFVAVLEKFPRIDGEILIISRKTGDDAYNDVSDIANLTENERENLGDILGKTINLMRQNLKAEKVYLYCFCEHWEEHEIEYEDKLTTEHLHFHLLPRYFGMRHKHLAAEKIFSIPTKELNNSQLKALKEKLLNGTNS
jgi:diadenosine tetraphosphate (Ap4A) HIT family hydrolase